MPKLINWWHFQFIEGVKEITRVYDQFSITREIEYFDQAYGLAEELSDAYELEWSLREFVKLGRVWQR